jgi:parallel beta-helix repeat protein
MVNTSNLTIDSSMYPEIGFLGIVNSTYVTIEDVRVTNNWQGVLLAYTNRSLIRNVTLLQDFSGIDLFQSFDNTLVGNNIEENSYGARLLSGSEATFYHNNFIGNLNNVQSSTLGSDWDNDLEGNYWSNYDGFDHDFDGIGDVAFSVGTNNTDDYPLMGLYSCFEASPDCRVEIVSNSTIQSFQYFGSNRTIEMCVSNMTSGQTAGFCRICILHELIDEPYSVLINGYEPFFANYALLSNLTHTWVYFSFQCGAGRVVILPESFSLLCFLAIAAVVLVGAREYGRKCSVPGF